jgi:putative peptide zinc metalloprotease protein
VIEPWIRSAVASATRVDTSEGKGVHLLTTPAGARLRLAEDAMLVLRLAGESEDDAGLAAALTRATGREIAAPAAGAALASLVTRLAALQRPTRQRSFWLRLPLLPAPAVRWLARPLARLFAPRAAFAAGLLAAGVLIALFFAAGKPALAGPGLLPAIGLTILSLLVHELGHAAACVRYGAAPSGIGATIYLIYPAFYSDVSDAWRLRRWQRVVVDLGGVYLQVLVAAVYAALHLLTGAPALHLAVWLIALSVAFSLNPVFKFDGYWVIADALGVTNLADQRTKVWAAAWDRLRGRPARGPARPLWIQACLLAYALGSWAFIGWFILAAGPVLFRHVVGYPGEVVRFASRLSHAPASLDRPAVLGFLFASFMVFIALGFAHQVALPLARGAAVLAFRACASALAPLTTRTRRRRSPLGPLESRREP